MKLIVSICLFVAGVFLVLALVVYPGYKTTSSRLYPTAFGYPAMLRLLGRPIPVEVGKAEPAFLTQTMMGQGFLSPHELVSIGSRTPNLVTKVLVEVGARVKKGDLLIDLDPGYAKESVKMAEASLQVAVINVAKLKGGTRPENVREKEATLAKAEGDLKTSDEQRQREQRLFDKGAIAREELETYETKYRLSLSAYATAKEDVTIAKYSTADAIRQAEANVDSARADLEERRKDLQETKLYAPSDGIVISRDTEAGDVTRGAGQQMLALAHGLEFQALLDQRYFLNIHIGQDAEVFLEAYSERSLNGKVLRINPSVQGATTQAGPAKQQPPTFSAWIALNDLRPGVSLAPGMPGFARIVSPHRALAVPTGAIINFSGGEGLVLVVRNSRVVTQPVRFGATSGNMTEILDGLAAGDVVVLSGQDGLKPRDRVTAKEHAST